MVLGEDKRPAGEAKARLTNKTVTSIAALDELVRYSDSQRI